MTPIQGEDHFQDWVQNRITASGGHFEDHRFSAQPSVPDLSCGFSGMDYWLELKYGEFKLLHNKYDDLVFSTMQRRQLDWLEKRQRTGRATCGVLGYFVTRGDYRVDNPLAYVFFMQVHHFLEYVWQKKWSVGAAILSPCCAPAHCVATGRALFDFIDAAARRPLRN